MTRCTFTIGVTTRTSGHTKSAICNDFDRWHCSLVPIVIPIAKNSGGLERFGTLKISQQESPFVPRAHYFKNGWIENEWKIDLSLC